MAASLFFIQGTIPPCQIYHFSICFNVTRSTSYIPFYWVEVQILAPIGLPPILIPGVSKSLLAGSTKTKIIVL